MEKGKQIEEKEELEEAIELVLFQVSECYVYMIPPRKSAASYRADEWNVNKWAWEGVLKVSSKGEECIIRLEDKTTGELYARAFLREGEPHPVESVIDSSRYFVLRIEENIALPSLLGASLECGIETVLPRRKCSSTRSPQRVSVKQFEADMNKSGGRLRHAFIGIGFRERSQAYDFEAALHDHMKYLNKKKTAEEMEQQYQKTSSVDYSLKEGQTLKLQIKNKGGGSSIRSKFFEQGLNNLSLEEKGDQKEPKLSIIPPLPPPAAPLSPVVTPEKSPSLSPTRLSLNESSAIKSPVSAEEQSKESSAIKSPVSAEEQSKELKSIESQSPQDIPDDDFGDFQAAG